MPTEEGIDATPKWSDILPMLIEAATNGTSADVRDNAMSKLRRMAQLADSYVAEHTESK
jgi:hypothetical protein